jgi:cysteine desulfurase/selenocysteine lyase
MYDVYEVRRDFPVLQKVTYLDNAATTQTPISAVLAMEEYFYTYAGNYGRGAHRLARKTTEHYERSREVVADFIGGIPSKTVFTRNTTESINLVAHGIDWKKGDHIVTSLIEHHSNLLPWLHLRKKGVKVTLVPPNEYGEITPDSIDESLTGDTRLVTITHTSNVFGSVQDVKEISNIAHHNGSLCLVDAAQSVGHAPFNVSDLDCDFLAVAGHKGLLGPQGTGILYLKDPESITPLYLGGGTVHSVTADGYELEPAPSRFESGTPNIPGVIGLGAAVEYLSKFNLKDVEHHITSLSRSTAERLAELEHVSVYGPKERSGVVAFNIEGLNPHDVAIILDETKSICVRSGHHCAIPSINFLKVNGTVRASFALYNTEEEADLFVETVEKIARSLGG